MIVSLSIENFALIEKLSVRFSDGFSVITGETGAGKSILLGALGLVLGKRADLSSLKNKEEKCIIEGHFQLKNYNLKSFFDFRILKIKNSSAPFLKFYKEKSIQKINKGGWHFSYLMSPKTISEKIKNSGHIEYNSSNFTNIKNIQKKIKEFKDLFDRNMRLKKVNINKSYPQYILHNKNKLKRWIA